MTSEQASLAFDFCIKYEIRAQITLGPDHTFDFAFMRDARRVADYLREQDHVVTLNPEGYYARVV